MTPHEKILSRIQQLRTSEETFCVATIVRTADATSAKAGAKAVITTDGNLEGYVGGGCVIHAVKSAALQALAVGEARMIRVKPDEGLAGSEDVDGTQLYSSGCPSGGTVDIFLEPVQVSARVIVCGSSPVAEALINIARSVGLRSVHAPFDDDAEGHLSADSLHKAHDTTALNLQPRDSIVVVTQGKNDKAALQGALLSPCRYIGMVGSRKKLAHLKSQLTAEVSQQRMDELHGPAGLDIGAIAPEEIALSIIAQIVAKRRSLLNNQYEQQSN